MAKIKSTNRTYPLPIRETRWVGILFFIGIHLIGVIGTPLYIYRFGVNSAEWFLFLAYWALTNLAITVGYHRLFTHACYKSHPFLRAGLLFFGAAAFEQSALKWASQHRQHHQFTDTEQDPHNIKRGFWYAHAGWILFWKHRVNYDNVCDLSKSLLVAHQHRWYTFWSIGAGVLFPMAIGFWIGRPMGVFVMTVCLRMVLVMHSAFFINSFAHVFGEKRFDGSISASDHWLGAILTNGEGYHNYHHRFPRDYRNGVLWYHWDPSKWTIAVLARLGLAWDLQRASDASGVRTPHNPKVVGLSLPLPRTIQIKIV